MHHYFPRVSSRHLRLEYNRHGRPALTYGWINSHKPIFRRCFSGLLPRFAMQYARRLREGIIVRHFSTELQALVATDLAATQKSSHDSSLRLDLMKS
jgi:hypothetical protein